MRRSSLLRAAAALAALSMVAVACGGDDDDAGSGATTETAGGGELTGEPIRLMSILAVTGPIAFPQQQASMEAAAEAINAEGGINGRPLEVVICDAQSPVDPNPATRCARDMAEDDSYVAGLAPYNSFGAVTQPITHQAGLASIGNTGLSPAELTQDSSFPLTGITGPPLTNILVEEGVERPSVAYIDIEAGAQSVVGIEAYLEANYGTELTNAVPVPLTATDLAPQVAAALDNSDGVGLSLAPNQVAQFLRAYQQGNYDEPVAASHRAVLPSDIEALGEAAEGLLVVAGLPFVSSDELEGIQRFKQEMEAYDPSAQLDEVSLTGWISTWAFALVAREIDGEVTRESVLETWQGLDSLDVFSLLPEDYDPNRGSVLEGFNRVSNVWVRFGRVEGGEAVDIRDEWVQVIERVGD